MRGDFFERYVRVEHFKALSRWNIRPDEKDVTLFCRMIFENFVFSVLGTLSSPAYIISDTRFRLNNYNNCATTHHNIQEEGF